MYGFLKHARFFDITIFELHIHSSCKDKSYLMVISVTNLHISWEMNGNLKEYKNLYSHCYFMSSVCML